MHLDPCKVLLDGDMVLCRGCYPTHSYTFTLSDIDRSTCALFQREVTFPVDFLQLSGEV